MEHRLNSIYYKNKMMQFIISMRTFLKTDSKLLVLPWIRPWGSIPWLVKEHINDRFLSLLWQRPTPDLHHTSRPTLAARGARLCDLPSEPSPIFGALYSRCW
jgi:hypothetical protein